MRRSLLGAFGFALFLLAACSGDGPERPAGQGPALWKVEKDRMSAFVFGTIHVLPKDVLWKTTVMRAAVASSDRLVLEADGLDDAARSRAIFDRFGRSTGLPPITSRVSAAQRPVLQALIARGGLRETTLSAYDSWAAAMVLATVMQGDLKLSGEQGVEPALIEEFRDAGKPVEGLETIEQQFSLFDRLPEATQRKFLSETVGQSKDVRAQFDRMLAAWLKGDMSAISRDFIAELASEPELLAPLLTDRNRAWADKVVTMRGQPFIAVGAAHLAGPGNLIALLEKKGFRAIRVQ
jgi:uncharacterized protein YbaP (TraB family)